MTFFLWRLYAASRAFFVALRYWPPETRVRFKTPDGPRQMGTWEIDSPVPALDAYSIKRADGPLGERQIVDRHVLERLT
jgi:hypothetical protein